MGKKRYQDPPAFYGTILCSRDSIRAETSTVAWSLAGTDSRLLNCDCAEHPAVNGSCTAKTQSGYGYSNDRGHSLCDRPSHGLAASRGCLRKLTRYVIARLDLLRYLTYVWATARQDLTPAMTPATSDFALRFLRSALCALCPEHSVRL